MVQRRLQTAAPRIDEATQASSGMRTAAWRRGVSSHRALTRRRSLRVRIRHSRGSEWNTKNVTLAAWLPVPPVSGQKTSFSDEVLREPCVCNRARPDASTCGPPRPGLPGALPW